MNDQDRTLRRFLVTTFGLGLGLQVPALFDPAFLGLGLIVMLTPAIGVLVAGPIARQRARAMLRRPWPWRWVLAGAVGGLVHRGLGIAIALASGAAHVADDHVQIDGWWVIGSDLVWLFPATGEHVVVFVLHNALLLITAGAVLMFPFALGEEIAWRGYLLPEFERRWGAWRGTFALGILWAFWHIGFMLSGHNNGGDHVVLNAIVIFPLLVTVFGLLLAWLVRSSGSVVPAVVAHGVNNAFDDSKMVVYAGWWQEKAVSLGAAAIVLIGVSMLFARTPAARYADIVDRSGS